MGTTERRNEIVKILCRRRYETIGNLANEFNVSYRTIRRDIDALSSYVPIYTQSGRYCGGVYMVDGYSMDNVYMNDDELGVLRKIFDMATENRNLLNHIEMDTLDSIIHKYSVPKKQKT